MKRFDCLVDWDDEIPMAIMEEFDDGQFVRHEDHLYALGFVNDQVVQATHGLYENTIHELEATLAAANGLLAQAKDLLWHTPGGHQALIDDIESHLNEHGINANAAVVAAVLSVVGPIETGDLDKWLEVKAAEAKVLKACAAMEIQVDSSKTHHSSIKYSSDEVAVVDAELELRSIRGK